MKRQQHPDNPDLFWCPKCQTYSPLTDEYWYKRASSKDGFRGRCKSCMNQESKNYYDQHRNEIAIYRRQYAEEKKEIINIRKRRWQDNNKSKRNEIAKKYQKKRVDEIRETYIISNMKRYYNVVTPEMVELTRQRIIMKRTLKQFKEGMKKEYESVNQNVATK
jgi:hypothetical protein